MNEKITLQILASKMAVMSGLKKKDCEDFIRELFSQVTSELESGESVKVKGLGTFKLTSVDARKSVNVSTGKEMEIPAHHKVTFTPAKELAAIVNSNLGHLEPVELNDNLTSDDIDFISSADDVEIQKAQNIKADMPAPTPKTDNVDEEVELRAAEDVKPEGIKTDQVDKTTSEESLSESETKDESKETSAELGEETSLKESATSENLTKTVSDSESSIYDIEAQRLLIDDVQTESQSEVSMDTKVEDKVVEESKDEVEDEESNVDSPVVQNVHNNDSEEIMEEQVIKLRRVRSSSFVGGFLTGLLLAGAIILSLSYFYNISYSVKPRDNSTVANKELPNTVALKDSVDLANVKENVSVNDDKTVNEKEEQKQLLAEDPVPTQPSDKKVYDTISTTRYLTTMARDHYGSYHLWPYIYEENKGFLGHPDRIRPGTQVVIPDLKKYNVDPKNPADIAKAKKLGAAIYARYQ